MEFDGLGTNLIQSGFPKLSFDIIVKHSKRLSNMNPLVHLIQKRDEVNQQYNDNEEVVVPNKNHNNQEMN